ncbi:hypothetical protein WJX74_005387 [Apatococcus lobatus]|uniref:Uncharacterized protein n=1 Tax=Apatococcus lobatus TaxID=904363 RepID=A0AAW1RPY0_9CHLO
MQQLPGIHPAFLASMQQMQAQQQQQQVAQQPPQQLPQQQLGGPHQQQLLHQQQSAHQQQQHMGGSGTGGGLLASHATNSLGFSQPTPEPARPPGAGTPSLEQKQSGLGTPRSNQSLQAGSSLDTRMQAPQQPAQPSIDAMPGMSFSFMANPATLQQQQQQQQQQAAGLRVQGSLGHGFPGGMVKHEGHLGGLGTMDPLARIGSSPLGMVAGIPIAGPNCWLPPSTLDTSQDHMRRPPAA